MKAEFLVVVLGQVQEDGAGLEDGERAACVVDDGGDAAVGIDFAKGGGFLLVGAEVNGRGGVGDAELFEEDGDFLTVWRGGGEEFDVGGGHGGLGSCESGFVDVVGRWI